MPSKCLLQRVRPNPLLVRRILTDHAQLLRYGFCGTTPEFCDVNICQSNCGSPSMPPGPTRKMFGLRLLGVTELGINTTGSAKGEANDLTRIARRKCHQYPPEAIAIDGLTHVNFAFAYIGLDTYTITTMDSPTPAEPFARTAGIKTLKSGNSNLQIFVAIGAFRHYLHSLELRSFH